MSAIGMVDPIQIVKWLPGNLGTSDMKSQKWEGFYHGFRVRSGIQHGMVAIIDSRYDEPLLLYPGRVYPLGFRSIEFWMGDVYSLGVGAPNQKIGPLCVELLRVNDIQLLCGPESTFWLNDLGVDQPYPIEPMAQAMLVYQNTAGVVISAGAEVTLFTISGAPTSFLYGDGAGAARDKLPVWPLGTLKFMGGFEGTGVFTLRRYNLCYDGSSVVAVQTSARQSGLDGTKQIAAYDSNDVGGAHGVQLRAFSTLGTTLKGQLWVRNLS